MVKKFKEHKQKSKKNIELANKHVKSFFQKVVFHFLSSPISIPFHIWTIANLLLGTYFVFVSSKQLNNTYKKN